MYGADADEEIGSGKNEDEQHDDVVELLANISSMNSFLQELEKIPSLLPFNELGSVLAILDEFHTENLR